MDLILFPTYQVPSALNWAEREAPAVTAARFAEWPEHLRREFALLSAEAGYSDRRVLDLTGIPAEALARARETSGRFALSYSDARVSDDEPVGGAHVEERAPAGTRQHGRGGWKKRRQADA